MSVFQIAGHENPTNFLSIYLVCAMAKAGMMGRYYAREWRKPGIYNKRHKIIVNMADSGDLKRDEIDKTELLCTDNVGSLYKELAPMLGKLETLPYLTYYSCLLPSRQIIE
ncbi:hypothetical protein WN51_14552 [Melipona quadrifasciata]|uniref:Uncharacterized protein n=1 Tax=Melipona quadrifasciata TaxID=166423 RepID=A0A0M8ZXE5_9HYME|nr:hypothetical protein WN51_14552 [Melipona quadrifasciata]